MFGHTFFSADMPNSTKPKVPSATVTSAATRKPSPGLRLSTKSNVTSPLSPHLRTTQNQTTLRMSSHDKDVSSRYTNSSFCRLPSPPGVVIRPGSASKGTRNVFAVKLKEEKEDSSISKYRAVKERRSDIIKRPLLTSTMTRPKTAMSKRTADKCVQESPSFQSNVLVKVKDALENLMNQKDSIDRSDLDRVMAYVRSQMNDKESVRDNGKERKKIEVEPKSSKTAVNIMSPSLIFSSPRREKMNSIANRRFFGQTENSLGKKESSLNVLGDEGVTPDNDDKGEGTCQQNTQNQSENKMSLSSHLSKELKKYFASEESQNDVTVGDSQANDGKSLDIWKAVEEIDLRSYIKSLVKDMSQELQVDKCLTALDNHSKASNTVSKTVSISKICTSDSTASKKTDSIPNGSKTPKTGFKPSSTGVKTSRYNLKTSESRCKLMLKRNSRSQNEAKTFPKNQQVTSEMNNKSETLNFNFGEPTTASESKEDLYLQRRRRLAGTRKDVKVLHFGQ